MSHSAAEQRLYEIWGEVADLGAASQLLEWDQETQMPEAGQPGRGQMLGTLASLRHRLLVSAELADVLDACAEQAPAGSVLAAQVREARRTVDRVVKIPEVLARALAEAQSRGTAAWQRARAAADFAQFAPSLTELVGLQREMAAAIRPHGSAYDALLDGFEPGAEEAWLAPLFAELEQALGPRVRAILDAGKVVDEAPARGSFPAAAQERFSRRMAAAFGFDFDRGRLDLAAHPFCVGLGTDDVRMTWRYDEEDFRPALFGVLHEAGHGLYEQGLPLATRRQPIGDAVSLGIHESQSRLWENHVGRSRGFWRWARPAFEAAFPDAGRLDVDALWPALHTVRPSLIRVEADEATYNLHIVIRFDIERRLIGGEIDVADLPAAWDERYRAVLGIAADNAADGVLQDIHWSQGLFGYFPTYTLGTMAAAQLFAAAERDLGDLESAFARGDFGSLLDWLRQNVHRHGSRYEARELIARATGHPLASDDLLAYLDRTIRQVYH